MIGKLVAGVRKEIKHNIFLIAIKYFELFTFGMTVHCTSEKIMREKNHLKY